MPSNHLILCCPLLLMPSIFPSIRIFSNESVLHIRWPKYWSFSFSISPSNEYGWVISLHGLAVHNFVFTEAEYIPKARTGIPGTHTSWSTLMLGLSKHSLEFSIRYYGETRTNFLANPTLQHIIMEPKYHHADYPILYCLFHQSLCCPSSSYLLAYPLA